MKSALFIGRFQPFHSGHLSVIQKILSENDRVIIVIGSAEKNFLPKNPLTAGERYQLIEEALKEAKIPAEKYAIIPVRNVNNYALWVPHVNMHVPPYQKLYTGSPIVKACYLDHPHVKIIQLSRNEIPISASEVRDEILKQGDWEKLVPNAIAKRLKEWHIFKRLKTIGNTMDETKYNNAY